MFRCWYADEEACIQCGHRIYHHPPQQTYEEDQAAYRDAFRARNDEIRVSFHEGVSLRALASEYDLTMDAVSYIVAKGSVGAAARLTPDWDRRGRLAPVDWVE